MRGHTVKTPERIAEARRLRAEGLTLREVGERFGVSTSTIGGWLRDPDGSRHRARKDSYAQPCMDCGGPTSGSEGRRAEPRCLLCANVKNGAEAKIWTPAALILAIEEWAHKYGEPPAMADWNPTQARILNDEVRAVRYEREHAAGVCPSFATVVRAFGTWNAAMQAAGFVPRANHGGDGNEQRRRYMRAAA